MSTEFGMTTMMTKRARKLRGAVLIYLAVAMVAMIALVSIGVDLARAQKVKTELQIACDAAARNGASSLFYSTDPTTLVATVQIAAKNTASSNLADGESVTIGNADIEFGTWSTAAQTFTVLSGDSRVNANAVRVTVNRTTATGNAVPLAFGAIIGKSTCDITVQTIAMQVPAINLNQNVRATGDPFLAGMPKGSVASAINPNHNPDYAGDSSNLMSSPDLAQLSVTPGSNLSFDSISGTAKHDPNLLFADPDGDLTEQIGHNNLTTSYNNNYSSTMYNDNGIADAWIPINAVVGVFLDDNAPNTTPAPSNLDFRTAQSRDFTTLQPQLKQLFFIGDGLNSGGTRQQFVVPSGATRLYLATMDYYEWTNNAGYRTIRITQPKFVTIVK